MTMAVESLQMKQLLIVLLSLGGFIWCYARGGRSHKWIRRFVGSLFLVLGCFLIATMSHLFRKEFLFALIAYPAALSMGYGGTSSLQKFWRRLVYGLGLGAASGCFFLPLGMYGTWIAQIILATWISLWAGLTNPTSAVGEEGLLASFSVALVPFLLMQ